MATHNVSQLALKDYLESVDKGLIRIPEFQRDFVWSKANMIKLVSSLLKGYPIGSFLLMKNTKEYANRPVEGAVGEYPDTKKCSLVLDGQQRTTTAYQIFYSKGDYLFYFDYSAFIKELTDLKVSNINDSRLDDIVEDNIDNWIIVFDTNSKKAPTSQADEIVKGLFPISSILVSEDETDYNTWLSTYAWDKAGKNIIEFNRIVSVNSIFTNRLVHTIISYQASQIEIDGDTSANVVCTIFETINSTGVKLTITDLLNAKCFPYKFFMSQEIEKAFENNHIFKDFDNESRDEFIGLSLAKLVGLLIRNSCKKSDLLRLEPSDIKSNWEKAVVYLKNGLEFIKSNFGVLGFRLLPYRDMLPCISKIINDDKFDNSNRKHIKKISRWYWHCIFTGYFDNATEAKNVIAVNEFLGDHQKRGWLEDDLQVPTVIRLHYSSLMNSNFDVLFDNISSKSATYKSILNLITLRDAPDFMENSIPVSEINENQLQDHHIFPKKFLSHHSIKDREANTIVNRTLISTSANQKIKDKQPNIYFNDKQLFGSNIFGENELSKHFIDVEFVDGRHGNGNFTTESYQKFKLKRHAAIVEAIKDKLRE